jgi:hypothetical protein
MQSQSKTNKSKKGGMKNPSPSRRQARYGRLVRGWDWRTDPELLQQAENERIKRGISRTEFLELAISSLLGRNPTQHAPDRLKPADLQAESNVSEESTSQTLPKPANGR